MKNVLCVGAWKENWLSIFRNDPVRLFYCGTVEAALQYLHRRGEPVDLVLYETGSKDPHAFCRLRREMLRDQELAGIPFILLSGGGELHRLEAAARKFKVRDYFGHPFDRKAFKQRVLKILGGASPRAKKDRRAVVENQWSTPGWKRFFDLVVTSVCLLFLSPLFLLVMLLIKLESPGPVFYVSKRAGQGYRVFDFYKFRSMRLHADRMIEQLKSKNQYQESVQKNRRFPVRSKEPVPPSSVLVKDDGFVEELQHYRQQAQTGADGTFFKLVNDPRITRIGRFIRSTSIDELPQLINVLKGDMSLVGNRPLPLYEAEQLTEDDWIMRFSAPAGITGLWQVTRRGERQLSEEERKQLDIDYARGYSIGLDLWILWRTLPAAIQKVNV